MNHKQLVEAAYKWVLNNGGVGIALKELSSCASEIPDVIGFDSWQSIVIECKASRSDFLCDMKKPHRAKGMGNWRFYCCPKGMIRKHELPAGWGLIYVNEKGKARVEYDCRYKKTRVECSSPRDLERHPEGFYFIIETDDENRFKADLEEERRIMYSALRRLFIKGFVKHIYDKKYNRNTTPNELILLNDCPGPK